MPLTGTMLKQATGAIPGGATGKKVDTWDALAAGATDAMTRIGLRTRRGCATFLATCALESAYWRTTTEYGSGQRYAPYVGRGFIQTTWKDGYQAVGAYAHEAGLINDPTLFVDQPATLARPEFAWLTAVEYYTRPRSGAAWTIDGTAYRTLAQLADSKHGTIARISRAVNRGNPATEKAAYHEEQRARLADAFEALGDAIIPTPPTKPTPKPKPKPKPRPKVLAEDGVAGPATWTRARTILNASADRWVVLWLQRQLNAKGYRDEHGRRLTEDGYGLTSNTQGETEKTHTTYAFSRAMGVKNPDGRLSKPSAAVREWQRRLNAGRAI